MVTGQWMFVHTSIWTHTAQEVACVCRCVSHMHTRKQDGDLMIVCCMCLLVCVCTPIKTNHKAVDSNGSPCTASVWNKPQFSFSSARTVGVLVVCTVRIATNFGTWAEDTDPLGQSDVASMNWAQEDNVQWDFNKKTDTGNVYVRYYFHSFKTAKADSCLQLLLEVCLACCIAFHLKHSEGKRDSESKCGED